MTSIIKVDQIQTSTGGTPTAADLGLDNSGSILQVKSSTLTGPFTVSTSWGFTEITGLEVSITPKSTNSHFMLCARINSGQRYYSTGFRFYRDDVNISEAIGDAAGSRTRVAFGQTVYSGSVTNSPNDIHTVCMDYLDTNTAADTATPIQFSIYGASYNASYPLTVNYAYDNSDSLSRIRTISTFTVYEIAG